MEVCESLRRLHNKYNDDDDSEYDAKDDADDGDTVWSIPQPGSTLYFPVGWLVLSNH